MNIYILLLLFVVAVLAGILIAELINNLLKGRKKNKINTLHIQIDSNGEITKVETVHSSIPKEESLSSTLVETPEAQSEENKQTLPEKEGEYCGVLHTSTSKGKRFERPIMVKKSTKGNKDIYFEYNEEGKQILLYHSKKLMEELRSFITACNKGETPKSKIFKWYPLKEKEQ